MPRRFFAATLFLIPLAAQTFDPKVPAPAPEVSGKVIEQLTLRHIEVLAGTGTPAEPGKEYTVHYTGWLRDGTKFDSSVDRGQPFKFVQGRRQVIAGWEAGFEGMKTGGKRRLFIPYQMAYGEKGSGRIPPKAELIFDVELLEVKDAPEIAPATDVLMPLAELERKVIALAKAVPEDKYSWRPAPAVRSFGEVFLHIANGNHFLLRLSATPPSREELTKIIQESLKSEKEPLGKDKIVARLEESFAVVKKTLEPMRAGALNSNVEFFGRPNTRRGIFVLLDGHVSEHLGQAIAYSRMNGIKPPWSGE